MFYDPYGLYCMDDVWGGIYWATNGWSPSQSTVDFSAGLGDSLLFGFGDDLRDLAGVGGVNQCSSAYKYGGYSSFAFGGARIAYSGLAKAGSMFASSAASASNFRNGLKIVFRGGLFPNFRKKTYEALKRAGKTDAQIRASAGRTNSYVNAVGAQAGIGGAIVTGQSDCECSQ